GHRSGASGRDGAMTALQLPPELTVTTGETDPIRYYRRPLVGGLFRRRIEMGLDLLGDAAEGACLLEIGYGAGIVLYNLRERAAELQGLDLDADPAEVGQRLSELGVQ